MLLLKTKKPSTLTKRNVRLSNLLISSCSLFVILFLNNFQFSLPLIFISVDYCLSDNCIISLYHDDDDGNDDDGDDDDDDDDKYVIIITSANVEVEVL